MRRLRHHMQKTENHGRIIDAVSIRERPATVEDRAVPGHSEGGLLVGSRNSQIATLVEHQTRYVMLVKVAGKNAEMVFHRALADSEMTARLRLKMAKELRCNHGVVQVNFELMRKVQSMVIRNMPILLTKLMKKLPQD